MKRKVKLNNFDRDEGLIVKDEITLLLNKSIKSRISGKQKTVSFSQAFKEWVVGDNTNNGE